MNINDLYIVLYYYWIKDKTPYPNGRQIIQLAFLLLVSAYTTGRLGALVYIERNEKINIQYFFGNNNNNNKREPEHEWDLRHKDLKTLYYRQISLILLPNLTRERGYLVIEVDLRYTKGHQSRLKR